MHSWIEPREDKVEAKGKGTLQTYWLNGDKKTAANHQRKAQSYSGIFDVPVDEEVSKP